MPTTVYTHPEWSEPKSPSESGRVSDVGSFPRNWLPHQDAATLTVWGITEETIPDPPPPTLDEVKTSAKSDVNHWKVTAQATDFKFTVGPTEYDVQNDPTSKLAISGAAERAKNGGNFDVEWRMSDNADVPVNKSQMQAMFRASSDADALHHATAIQAKADIDAAADEATVQAILDALP